MINEEMTDREINLAVRVGDTAVAELKKGLEKALAMLEGLKTKPLEQPSKDTAIPKNPNNPAPQLKSGKQTLKQLHQHNAGLSAVSLKNPNLRKLKQSMKKYDIDFACVKDGKGKYTLFFKGNNAEEMTHAFKRYTEQMVKIADKKAIKTALREAKAQALELDAGRGKEKNKSRGAR